VFRGSERDGHVQHVGDDLLPQPVHAAAGNDAGLGLEAQAPHEVQALGKRESHSLQDRPGHLRGAMPDPEAHQSPACVRVEVGRPFAAQIGQEQQPVAAGRRLCRGGQ